MGDFFQILRPSHNVLTLFLDDLRSGINDWVEKVLKKKKLEMKKVKTVAQRSYMNETDNFSDFKQSNKVVDQPGKFQWYFVTIIVLTYCEKNLF